jgi:hypothetical protein
MYIGFVLKTKLQTRNKTNFFHVHLLIDEYLKENKGDDFDGEHQIDHRI